MQCTACEEVSIEFRTFDRWKLLYLQLLRMCDLSVLVEDYLSLAPAEKLELPHTLEEYAMRVIIGMLPVLVWIVRTAREAAALTAALSALSAQEEPDGRPKGRRRRRAAGAERNRVIHLVVWGSPSTGYWTSLPFGDNQRQVFIHCQLLLLCAVLGGVQGLCELALQCV